VSTWAVNTAKASTPEIEASALISEDGLMIASALPQHVERHESLWSCELRSLAPRVRKLDGYYPINAHLGMLLDDIIADTRWDMTYLGMQIMVEGLALAAFGFISMLTTEPLLKQLLKYVMSDEARHVAFGVLTLQDYYQDITDAEMKERQEFAFEASVRMRDRFLQQDVWERMGVPAKDAIQAIMLSPQRAMFTNMLFSKIVPNCKKLGLLDRNDKWLRRRFEELGVIQFEDWVDTSAEYEELEARELVTQS